MTLEQRILDYHARSIGPGDIASRCHTTAAEVREVLSRHGIEPPDSRAQSLWELDPAERSYRHAIRAAKGARRALKAMGAA